MPTLLRAGRPASGLTVSVLYEPAELQKLSGEWTQLLARSAGHHPSLTPTWLLTWWRVFGEHDGRRLHVLVIRDAREVVGIVPMLTRRQWHYRAVPMQRLELVASGEDTADEIMSEYLGPIVATGREDEVVLALVEHLASHRSGWHEIALVALDGEAPAVRKLEPAFRAAGFACDSRVSAQCPFIALPSRWDDYLAALKRDDRYMVKRSLRDFESWAGSEWKMEVVRTHEELARGKEILHRLHEHRWQTGGREGVFVSPSFRRFHDMMMPALLDQGALDLKWLVVRGEPVAVSYSIIDNRRLYYYQGGRATAVPKGVRPGIVLHLHAIRAAIDSGYLEYDFLGGDARYKLQLATGTRPLLDLRIVRPSVPEVMRSAVATGRTFLKQARERVRARH